MIIYEIEILINRDLEIEWVQWMESTHIKDVMNTNLFNAFRLLKKLNAHHTYIVQYETDSIDNYIQYEEFFAKSLKEDHMKKFEGMFQAKRRLYKEIK
tara:strand:+ start:122 stop:415 length:294 start_codon:yes stop_codon:yes gene_type:complete